MKQNFFPAPAPINLKRESALSDASLGQSSLSLALRIALCGLTLLPFTAAAQVVIEEGESVSVPGNQSSPWTIPSSGHYNGDLQIHGSLTINNAGVVNVPTANMWSLTPTNAPASVLVSGPGSIWNTDVLKMSMGFGLTSQAALTIENGGVVNTREAAVAWAMSFSQAAVTVRGAGSAWNIGQLRLGVQSASGTLNVLDGGRVSTSDKSEVGSYYSNKDGLFESRSSARISGAGSRWDANGGLEIERGSQVILSDGGVLATPKVTLTTGFSGSISAADKKYGGLLAIGGGYDRLTGVAEAPAAPGVLDAPVLEFGLRSGYLVFNHTSSNYDFNAQLVETPWDPLRSGDHILALAGTTRLTADNGGFSGTTSVQGGTLLVNGKLGGDITVSAGVLGGSGEVGTLTVGDRGRLAPGNSIGTLTVNGDLTFAAGSIYEVEVTPQGASDQVAVGGKAVINGGSVISVGQDSGFKPFTQYTILTAGGGVSGQFASASNNYAFLNPSLVYEPNAVKLQLLRNDVSFGSVGVTANQRAVASGAESTGPGHPVWNAIAVLSADQARAALDSLSGELHASTQAALIEDALSIQHAVLDGYADSERRGDTQVWLKALGARAQIDATRETAKLERDSSGLLIGADFALGEDWRLGALLGAGKTRNDVDALGSRSESDNLHVGVYADAAWENGWRLRLGGIRSNYDLDTRRRVTVAGLGGEFTAGTDARATQFYGELGYAFDAGAVELEPFLSVSRVKLNTDGFGEQGGVGALQGENVDASTRYATLGLRLGYGFGDSSRWRLGGSLAWRRASGDLEPVSKLRFDGGQSFLIEGAPIARSAAVVTAGVSAKLSENTSLDLSYLGQIASDADDHGASAKLMMRF